MGGREVGHWLMGLGELRRVILRAPWPMAGMALCVYVYVANIFVCVHVPLHVCMRVCMNVCV